LGFGVWGLGFWDFKWRSEDCESFVDNDLWCRVYGLGVRVWGLELGVYGLGVRVWGLELGVYGLELW